MKNFIILLSAAFLISCGNNSNNGDNIDTPEQDTVEQEVTGNYTIQVEDSEIEWTGKHFVGDDRVGNINIKDGSISVENEKLTGGEFTMDMTTIQNTSIEDTADRAKITTHLKNADFFDVANHPTSAFKITAVSDLDSADFSHLITGDLTIKGITNSISFPAIVELNGPLFNATASFNIDRRKWNIMHNSKASFLKKLIDIPKKYVVEDFVGFSINIVAKNK